MYVEDLLIAGNNNDRIDEVKEKLRKEFDMNDLGLIHYYLGIEVWQKDDGIFISQSRYAKDLLNRFHMEDCKISLILMEIGIRLTIDDGTDLVDNTLYRQLVGSLIYLTNTRPDIAYSVGKVTRYMTTPRKTHWIAVKRILRYIKGTLDNGIWYTRIGKGIGIGTGIGIGIGTGLTGYTDADWASSLEDMKSTTGYVFHLGSGAVSWCSKKQHTITLSSIELEYRATSTVVKEVIWLRRILEDLQYKQA